MKTAIIYYSRHHGNTKKLLDKISELGDIDLVDITNTKNADLSEYEYIGFASGIYYGKFQKSLIEFAKNKLPENKKVFLIYTCGLRRNSYTTEIMDAAKSRGAEIIGEYGCLGFDTFGPFKLIGGLAKGHPNEEEIDGAVKFFKDLMSDM